MSSVVQSWLGERCTFKMQTVVLSALRGCDGKPKEDPSKKLTRKLRSFVLYSAHANAEDRTFMRADDVDDRYVDDWVQDLDHYPVHWLMHFAHACQIVAVYHPDSEAKIFWSFVYIAIVDALHLPPEPISAMQARLMDNPDNNHQRG